MINVVMTTKDRPVLTRQSLVTLARNTVGPWNLTVVDDNSQEETRRVLSSFQDIYRDQVEVMPVQDGSPVSGILGGLKSLGVLHSARFFDCQGWLYLSDNDVYFTPGWNARLTAMAGNNVLQRFRVFGGQNHPYHQPISEPVQGFKRYGAVAGTSWLMSWETWANYGPLDSDAVGTCQSEDTAFCNRVTRSGYLVGAMDPPAVYDTGITQTDGTPSIGADVKKRFDKAVYV